MQYGGFYITKQNSHYVVKDADGKIICTADTLSEAKREVDSEEAA